jgi:hypothetical protein
MLALCGPSFSQPVLPDTFESLNEPELAEQCFYRMQMHGKLTFELWESTKSEKFLAQLSRASMAAELWRGRAQGVSGERFASAMGRAAMQSDVESDRIHNYCFGMAGRHLSLLTPAQQSALQNRALNRAKQYTEKALRID